MNDILNIIADDQSLIVYRKELNKITGSVTATILLQQLMYWYKQNGNKPFYKFIEPCKNDLYIEGDSWVEELGFTKKEFAGAYKKLEEKGIVSKKINMARVTFYDLNLENLSKLLKGIYVSDKRELTKVTKGDLDNDISMNLTETTTERKKDTKKDFSFTLKKDTHYDQLSLEYKTKLRAKCLLIDGDINRYEDFILSLKANAKYKYKDFTLVYKKWDKEKRYKQFSPESEPSLGAEWVRIPLGNSWVAINKETLELREGVNIIKEAA